MSGGRASVHNRFHSVSPNTVVQVGIVSGDFYVTKGENPVLPTPRQLPAPPHLLLGRGRELTRLDAALDLARDKTRVAVLAVEGCGGIGKTALALYWAHTRLSRFPDAQLYVDLGERGDRMLPVLHDFLIALGLDPAAMPHNEEAAKAMFRSTLADRAALLVLDNVSRVEQVRALMPNTSSCAVLVTSRGHLSGLDLLGGTTVRLDPLETPTAQQVFEAYLGADTVSAEPEATEQLLTHCAGLPLALVILAARAAEYQASPLTSLAAELTDPTRLAAFETSDGGLSLRAVLDCAAAGLDADQARTYRLLGGAPTAEATIESTTSLLASSPRTAQRLLHALTARNLLAQTTPGRFRMHPLVRAHASEGLRDEPPAITTEALRRLVDHYVHTACAADRLLFGNRSHAQPPSPPTGCAPLTFAGADHAMHWFTQEHRQLMAMLDESVRRGWPEPVWYLSRFLDTYHYRRGHLEENVSTSRAGVVAASELDSPGLKAAALRQLGRAYTRNHEFDEATHCLDRALDLLTATGDPTELAHTHHDLGRLAARQGNLDGALRHSSEAVRLYRAAGNAIGESHALNALGRAQAERGVHAEAETCCRTALRLSEEHDNPSGRMVALDNLGYLALGTGALDDAADYHSRAAEVAAVLGARSFEAEAVEHLADALIARRADHPEAADALRRAHDLYLAQHRVGDAQRCAGRLAELS
ncbi:tetratricopeptide repeat protein [Actinokineospora enzanensis]|uniref:tetratricopeptide repeat protein n=1 Tax=Actinokineospora enzanensis TaxID=155975 RepID=UPI00037FD55E|nr:tetratricopeptide repeat protein [Actinokineospora enzanensis]